MTVRENLYPAAVDALEERITLFNSERTGKSDARQLAILLEAGGEVAGAVVGFTWAGFCELRQVWVDEAFRGQGHGRALMQKAIEEARRRGCSHVDLATYSFQAPGFYEKLGFESLAVIPGRPPSHCDHLMRLKLGREAGRNAPLERCQEAGAA